jgi:uncharacterized membrane protein YgaE (UPF0421/DUF939 family)
VYSSCSSIKIQIQEKTPLHHHRGEKNTTQRRKNSVEITHVQLYSKHAKNILFRQIKFDCVQEIKNPSAKMQRGERTQHNEKGKHNRHEIKH